MRARRLAIIAALILGACLAPSAARLACLGVVNLAAALGTPGAPAAPLPISAAFRAH